MNSTITYVIIWAILILVPVTAVFKRQKLPACLYALGSLLFLFQALRNADGWDDLVNLATLLAIVLPIYVVASFIWLVSYLLRLRRRA